MRITNEEVRKRANIESISEQVKRRRWIWLGHVLRMDQNAITRALPSHGFLKGEGEGVARVKRGEKQRRKTWKKEA